MNWSKFQNDIFDAGLNTNSNIAIKATAGSGKTTTIVELARRLNLKYPYKSILFNAFNKSIVEELKKRLPEKIDCSTINSIGHRGIMAHFKTHLKVDPYKTYKFAESLVKTLKLSYKNSEIYKYTLMDIIGLMRMTLVEPLEEDIDNLCQRHDITITNGEITHSLELLNDLNSYNKSLSKSDNIIDFTDQIYLPAINSKIKLKQYDIVLVDEAQDMNEAQHKVLEKLIKPNGRLITVGDNMQAIYGFAGADVNSFEKFEQRPNTISLPLSICYRCAKNIVINAQRINNEIQYSETQEDGEVRIGQVEDIQKNDYVICRNVRPLISLYFKLLEDNKKAFIKGRDIEKGLIALFSKVRDFDKFDAKILLQEKLDKLLEELLAKGIKKPKEHNKYLNLLEKVKILTILSDKVQYMKDVENKIHELFTDRVDAVKLSTIHKSKGLENDRIFFMETFNKDRLIPSKYAKQDWEKIQERNLEFVALSRAKKQLFYLHYTD